MGSIHYTPDDHSHENQLLSNGSLMSAATNPLGSTHSSPSSFDDDANMMGAPAWQPMQISGPPESAGSSATSSMPSKAPLPLQKRRRVTRACDECRRKKIKCDGKQPCTHCTVYSYECTYDQPSNRRRNPAPQYIEALENRLQRTETLLKAILPDIDVNHPEFDPMQLLPQIQAAATEKVASMCNNNSSSTSRPSENSSSTEKDSLLETMVEAAGRLEIDETGHMDFHGHSSNLTFLDHLNSQFGGLLGEVRLGPGAPPISKHVSSPASASHSPAGEAFPDTTVLPPRHIGRKLVETCLDDACVLMRFTHRPTVIAMFERVYNTSPENYNEEENSFLPLLYLALGVGCLFVNDIEKLGFEDPTAEAVKYFNAGRRMMEMTDIRDIYSIQAIILMIIFLQSSSRMSTCYSYVGIALSAALRMGLHRSLPQSRFDPVEREVRRRIFWTIWKMDTYVGALLGLPKGIADEDIDQEMPVEVDDEFITKDAILAQPPDRISAMVAANKHTLLLKTMAKVVKYIYPLKGVEASVTGNGFGYSVSMGKLHEIEMDLAKWFDELPMVLKPGGDTPTSYLKPQYLLKMSYAHVQMMLYRPFLHYVSRPKTKGCDDKPYAIAASCVHVARKIVSTTEEMRGLGILNGAYWFTIYTTFFSIITLVYYVLVNPPDQTSYSILQAAKAGRDCLLSVKDKSMAAKRCSYALESIFERIPQKISPEMEKAMANIRKKRSRAPSQVKPDGSDDDESHTKSSPGTLSPDGSVASSSPRRSKTLPATPVVDLRRMSTPVHLPPNNYASAGPDPMHRRSSYELYRNVDFSTLKLGSPGQQPPSFQAHLSGSGLPDLNAMMFPSPDYQYSPQQAIPSPQQQQFKTEPPTSPVFLPPRGSYESLQGNLFGPLPPYLLQGQQQIMGDNVSGAGLNPQENQRTGINGNGDPSSLQAQYYMSNGGGEAMVPDFFRDEWDDVLMQQPYRG